jgi:hypothetical protein
MMSNGSAEMTSLTSVSGGIEKLKKVSILTFPASAGEDIEKLKRVSMLTFPAVRRRGHLKLFGVVVPDDDPLEH